MNELMNENYTFHYHSYTVAVKITMSVYQIFTILDCSRPDFFSVASTRLSQLAIYILYNIARRYCTFVPPSIRVRATVKLSVAFFHDQSSIKEREGGMKVQQRLQAIAIAAIYQLSQLQLAIVIRISVVINNCSQAYQLGFLKDKFCVHIIQANAVSRGCCIMLLIVLFL